MKPANEFTYLRRNPAVQAVWWNGDNRDEVIRFFRDCGLPESEGPYFSRDDYEDDELYARVDSLADYNMVKAQGCGGLEADEKRWITWDGEDYETLTAYAFHSLFDADLMS